MTTPKFSVITVSYQHAEFIRQTIESVLAQNYTNFEHIVIDGGSTDGTIDILKQYPHLQWVSEPDRGQSHALNKGFSRATGDIIAWINSDDWYEPNIFSVVAHALETSSLVMGECQVCDRQGRPTAVVENFERTWFDLLKYWVFNSSPAQPSLFFRRDLLERVRYGPGRYVDEDLEFCMDWDLWLRMAEEQPLLPRIPRVLSHLRDYDTNKTGAMWDLTLREMSRVFARHSNRHISSETRMTIVVPWGTHPGDLRSTVHSLRSQTPHSLELLVTDHGIDQAVVPERRAFINQLSGALPTHTLRYVGNSPCIFTALNAAFQVARSPLTTVLQPGDLLPALWPEACEFAFSADSTALAIMYGPDPKEREMLLTEHQGRRTFNVSGIFTIPYALPNFVARTVALQELGGFKSFDADKISPLLAFRQLLLRLVSKGWGIQVNHSLVLPQRQPAMQRVDSLLPIFEAYIYSYLLLDLTSEQRYEPFFPARKRHNLTVHCPDELQVACQKIQSAIPREWPHILDIIDNLEQLQVWTKNSPQFVPAWHLLAACAQQKGDMKVVEEARQGLAFAGQGVTNRS